MHKELRPTVRHEGRQERVADFVETRFSVQEIAAWHTSGGLSHCQIARGGRLHVQFFCRHLSCAARLNLAVAYAALYNAAPRAVVAQLVEQLIRNQ